MLLSLVHSSCSTSSSSALHSRLNTSSSQSLGHPTSYLLPKSSDHSLKKWLHLSSRSSFYGRTRNFTANAIQASLLEAPVLWAGRVFVFYALLRVGLAGSKSNPFVSDLVGERGGRGAAGIAEGGDFGFSKLLQSITGDPDKEASDKRKLVSKWHPTTKGTLRRNYRVPSKTEGRRLLRAVAALLAEDDHFTDATSHKGCQIRRESAHGESVCCNNVRALFDELPTPHLIVEITPFPVGSLTEKDYLKAEKLERVLRSGPSV